MGKGFFVAATGQNVGKTTTCLGLIAGLRKRFSSVGFIKPVGQEHVEIDSGLHVDKDVVLFQSCFSLADSPEEMSPVLFPRGFTRDFLDGKVETRVLEKKVKSAYGSIISRHPVTVAEGTGHTGVGSIVHLNNAQVASLLGCPLVLVASGGLGSSFDELALNYAQCKEHGVSVAGVILNRVLDDKREMILHYMPKALSRWNIPLLGCIPYAPFLSSPTMSDFAQLFETELLTGKEHALRHFQHFRLVATSTEMFRTLLLPNQLIITPASREDIILATLNRYRDLKSAHPEEPLEVGLILTGKTLPKPSLLGQIEKTQIPMLHVPLSSFVVLKKINTWTAKIRKEDTEKVRQAIELVENNIDFDRLCLCF